MRAFCLGCGTRTARTPRILGAITLTRSMMVVGIGMSGLTGLRRLDEAVGSQ